jgi:hypothetical protein
MDRGCQCTSRLSPSLNQGRMPHAVQACYGVDAAAVAATVRHNTPLFQAVSMLQLAMWCSGWYALPCWLVQLLMLACDCGCQPAGWLWC